MWKKNVGSGPGLNLYGARRGLYRFARILGDLNALITGRIGQRIMRKVIYRGVGKQMRKILGFGKGRGGKTWR